MPLGSYERPAQRIGRLRNALMSTERSMGQTVTRAVDLEARRRTMGENLQRFRQVEQRLQPPAPSPGKRILQTGLGAVERGVAPIFTALNQMENVRRVKEAGISLTRDEEGRLAYVSPEAVEGAIREGNIGPLVDIGAPGSLSPLQGIPVLGSVTQPEAPFPGVLGRIPGLRTPGELAATTATLGVGGPLIGPATAVTGIAGATVGGKVAPAVGLPPWAGELAGGLAGGIAGGMAARPVFRAGQRVATGPTARRLWAEEAGGTRLGGEAGEVATHVLESQRSTLYKRSQRLLVEAEQAREMGNRARARTINSRRSKIEARLTDLDSELGRRYRAAILERPPTGVEPAVEPSTTIGRAGLTRADLVPSARHTLTRAERAGFQGEFYTADGREYIGNIFKVGEDQYKVYGVEQGVVTGEIPRVFRVSELEHFHTLPLSGTREIRQFRAKPPAAAPVPPSTTIGEPPRQPSVPSAEAFDEARAEGARMFGVGETPPPRKPPEPPVGEVPPPEDPMVSMKAKIAVYSKASAELRPGLEAERRVETAARAAALETEKTRLLAQGVPYDEAIQRASAKLGGAKATRTVPEVLGFTDEEADAFKAVIEAEAKTYEKVRLLANFSASEGRRAQPSIFAKMLNGEPVTPAEGELLRRLFGDEVAAAALSVGKSKAEFVRMMEETYGVGYGVYKRTPPAQKVIMPETYGMISLDDLTAPELQRLKAELGADYPRVIRQARAARPSGERYMGMISIDDLTGPEQAAVERALGAAYPRRIPKSGKPLPEEIPFGGVEYQAKVPQAVARAAKEPAIATKILDEILEIPRFFTGLYSLLDASWGGRQLRMLATGFVGPRKPGGRLPFSFELPRVWAKSYWETTTLMFRTSKSRAAYGQALRDDPTLIKIAHPGGYEDIPFGKLWQRLGGPLPEGQVEERVTSGLLRKLPGFKQSAEGYTLGLDAGHHSALKDELMHLAATGKPIDMKTAQALSDATTALTGRGNIGKWLGADIATALGWAPKLRAAFWNNLFRLGHPNAAVRSLAARRLAGYLGVGLTMMTVAEVTGGGQVTWNPLDTDFGKIKVKGIRFNVWGPDVVAIRYLAQGVFGYAASPLTGKYEVDWKDSLMRYLRSGANPAVGLAVDWKTGKTYAGEKFGILQWQERLPLAFQDIVDAFELKGGGAAGAVAGAAVTPFVMAGIGVSSYDRAVDRLARLYNEYVDQGLFGKDALYYADDESLTIKANVQKKPELTQLDSERNMLSRAENNEVKAELENQYNLPDFAKRFSAGETALGPQLIENWRGYRHDSRVAMDARTFGVDFGPETEDEKLLHAWLSINPNDKKYLDPATGKPDYDLVDTDSEAAEAKLIAKNPRLAAAVEEIISSLDPALQELEPDLEEALSLKSGLYDLPHWRGVSPEQEKEMENFFGQVEDARRFWASNNGVEVSVADAIPAVAQKLGKEPNFAQWAMLLRPGTKTEEELREPQYRQFLKDNRDKLEPYFPDLYGIGMLAEMFNETGGGLPSPTPVSGGTQTMPNIRMRPAGVR